MTNTRARSPVAVSASLLALLVALTAAGAACGGDKGRVEPDGGAAGGGAGDGGRPGSGGTTASCGAPVGGAGGEGGEGGAGGSLPSCAGNAISLGANGTGDASDAAHARVMVDVKDDLPIGGAARTVEFWAYVRSTDWMGGTNTFFEYGTEAVTGAAFGLEFGATPGSLRPYISSSSDSVNGDQPACLNTTVDQWVHFAMTWEGMAVRTYVNGVLRSSRTNPVGLTLATVRTYLTIGCSNPRFSCFGGIIDEFRLWKVARSAAEIAASYDKTLVGNEPGLVGYWRFNEPAGSLAAADSVTTAGHVAHPGTPTAVMPAQTPTFVTPNPPTPIRCP